MPDEISQRKLDHLDLCAEEDVEYRGKTTLLDDVELLHDSLPELDFDAIDTTTTLFGRALAAPLLITGMTGGAERARDINRDLAAVAQELGLAFGVGSQRAMLRDPSLVSTYQIRDIAPDILLFGNIGVVQAAEMSTAEAVDLVGAIGADALCVHLNPGQEMIQPEGDRDFRGALDALARLCEELDVPVIAKETGCGISARTAAKLIRAGLAWVDVSGAGGTTWVGVETLRSAPHERTVGEVFWDWGVPTAASVVLARRAGLNVIGSGGLRDGLDAAKAIALGASLAGMALPWLRAAHEGGVPQALAFGRTTIRTLRTAMLLTDSADLAALRSAPRVTGARLRGCSKRSSQSQRVCALVQAREKLSHCSVSGSFQGPKMISGSDLNAVMIIQRNGKITIAARNVDVIRTEDGKLKPGGYVVVSVTDSGPGIPDEHRARRDEPLAGVRGKTLVVRLQRVLEGRPVDLHRVGAVPEPAGEDHGDQPQDEGNNENSKGK